MHHASLNRLKLAFGNFMDTPNCQTGANSYLVIRITVYKTLVWLAPASSNHLRDKPIGYLCESAPTRPNRSPISWSAMAKWQDYRGFLSFHSAARGIPAYRCGRHAMSCNVDIFQEYVRPHQLTKSKLICETSQVVSLPVALRIRLRKSRDSLGIVTSVCNPLQSAVSCCITFDCNFGNCCWHLLASWGQRFCPRSAMEKGNSTPAQDP